jgi:type II secretory pathway pseudopilin PulG
MTARGWTTVAFTLVAILAIVAALIHVDSPYEERQQRIDQAREQDLQQIDGAILSFHGNHGAVPASLDELSRYSHNAYPHDPETNAPYHYVAVGRSSYRLCSTFYGAGQATAKDFGAAAFATHPAGAYCFNLVAPARVEAPRHVDDRP